MKYIVCQVKRKGEPLYEFPFVFPEQLVHAMVFSQMRAMLEHQFFSNKEKTEVVPIAAGFLHSMTFATGTGAEGNGFCHGESESLGVKSRGLQDDKLFMMNDYGAGAMV